MSSRQLLIAVVVALFGISYVLSGEETAAPPPPGEDTEEFHFDCKKLVWKIAKKVLQTFRVCSGELKKRMPDDKERSKYIQCSVKCTMTRLELINNQTGKMGDEDVDKFLSKMMIKPQFFDIARVIVGGCVEDFDNVTDEERNQEYCHAHGDLLKCLQNQITEIC